MTPRERILDSAARVFGQYGFRLASMELVAQECGLSRQALYHHFDSKEALFRAVAEAVHEGALEAERTAALREERAGKGLADIMAAQLEARYRSLFDLLKGSAHAEELLSEHRRQTHDLYQRFAQREICPDRRNHRARLRRERARLAGRYDASRVGALHRTRRARRRSSKGG